MKIAVFISVLTLLWLGPALVLAQPVDFQQRASELDAKVVALAGGQSEETVQVVLSVAVRRARLAHDAGFEAVATETLDDVEAALMKPAAELVEPSTENLQQISMLKQPRVVAGNPYIDRLLAGARAALAEPELAWPKVTEQNNPFDGLSGDRGSRDVAALMEAWLWTYANPASPLHQDVRALGRFLTLAHAYADAMEVFGKDQKIKPGAGIFDDFAIAPASCALREFAQRYPGLLLPSQKTQWHRAMRLAGDVMMSKAKGRQATYANIDLALAFQLLNFGLFLNDAEFLAQSKFLSESQQKNLYPDGGIAYLGHQNESHVYHNVDTQYLARIHLINGSEKILDILRGTEWYGPVTSGKLGEFWTVPSWKDTWNANESPSGGEPVAAVTGNPYLRGMNDRALAAAVSSRRWFLNLAGIPWYRNDVKPLPLPDHYTVIDRNIAGPRAWYGRFSYAASLRPIPETEPGLATLMGAVVLDESGGVGQALMGAYPRVQLKTETISAAGQFQRQAYAWLTSGLQSSLVTGRQFSALSGSYRLHQYGSSTKGPDVDWNGRQIWLGLPDRVVGLLELSAGSDAAKAVALEGVLRLGTGGTVNGKPVKIDLTGHDTWRYGDLVITIPAHNYATANAVEVPFRLPKFPNTEIRLGDSAEPTDGTLKPYPASTRHWFLVELRPSWTKTPATISKLDDGFHVEVDGKQFTVLANFGPNETDVTMPDPTGGLTTSIHRTRDVAAPRSKTVKLAPQELVVQVQSSASDDHAPGWTTFQELVSQPDAKPTSEMEH